MDQPSSSDVSAFKNRARAALTSLELSSSDRLPLNPQTYAAAHRVGAALEAFGLPPELSEVVADLLARSTPRVLSRRRAMLAAAVRALAEGGARDVQIQSGLLRILRVIGAERGRSAGSYGLRQLQDGLSALLPGRERERLPARLIEAARVVGGDPLAEHLQGVLTVPVEHLPEVQRGAVLGDALDELAKALEPTSNRLGGEGAARVLSERMPEALALLLVEAVEATTEAERPSVIERVATGSSSLPGSPLTGELSSVLTTLFDGLRQLEGDFAFSAEELSALMLGVALMAAVTMEELEAGLRAAARAGIAGGHVVVSRWMDRMLSATGIALPLDVDVAARREGFKKQSEAAEAWYQYDEVLAAVGQHASIQERDAYLGSCFLGVLKNASLDSPAFWDIERRLTSPLELPLAELGRAFAKGIGPPLLRQEGLPSRGRWHPYVREKISRAFEVECVSRVASDLFFSGREARLAGIFAAYPELDLERCSRRLMIGEVDVVKLLEAHPGGDEGIRRIRQSYRQGPIRWLLITFLKQQADPSLAELVEGALPEEKRRA